MKVTFHTGFKLTMASIVVIAGMTAAWIPLLGGWAIYAGVLTTGYVVSLGIPSFLLLRWVDRLTGANLAIAGFLCASVPTGIYRFTHPVFGERPAYLAALMGLMVFGLLGALCATMFWAIWNLLSGKQDRSPWLVRSARAQEASS